MARKKSFRFDSVFFLVILLAYLIGQALIGTYIPEDKSFHFDAPADIDFLYYAGIISQMKHSFPPQNPAYGGETLSQSFIQYYPVVLISFFMDSYMAMRILNIVYFLLFACVLRRYFPRGWSVGVAIIAAGSVGFGFINSLGIDLIARGFNHFPFFIALTVALFESEKRWLKYACLFLLGWFHSFSGLLALLYFVGAAAYRRFGKIAVLDAAVCLIGLASAASITMGVADKPFYFPFVEGFRVSLTDLWMHAVPAFILVCLARSFRVFLLFMIASTFGLLFHYNPFFPVFMLYFAAGWAGLEIMKRYRSLGLIPLIMAGLLFIGFIYGAIDKYNPRAGKFIPIIDHEYDEAGKWLEENTRVGAVVMTVPLDAERINRLMEKRALYLGFIPHVAHLGIDWRERGQKIISYFRKASVYMSETEYIIYGSNERNLFPDFELEDTPVYQGGNVKIWKVIH